MPKIALGLPDPNRYGDTSQLPIGQLIDWVVQKHLADRAGLHYDVRMGSPDLGLLSWAVRKGLPAPGQKHLAIQQPVHSHKYKDFQGTIARGYGKGDVSTHDKGEVLITRSSPNAVHFTTAHKGIPERFVLARTGQGRDGKGWLLINTTPTAPIPYEKKRYAAVSPERAEQIISQLPEGYSVQPKVDGAAILMPILKDKIEAVSYRQSKRTGGPIIHTERMFHGIPNPYDYNMPTKYKNSLLRGEAYAIGKDGKDIPPQDLGGILNSGLAKSIRSQQANNLKLNTMLFDVDRLHGKQITDETPYAERYKMLENIMPYLPKGQIHLAPQATTPDAAMKLWNQIKNREHGMTEEGIVIHPTTGKPMKTKIFNDHDVLIRSFVPGKGKYMNKGIGTFQYSNPAEGEAGRILGEVGTGFNDETRAMMFQNPQDYIGRIARVSSQERLRSGALRAPSFIALHEDYPTAAQQLPSITGETKGASNEGKAKAEPNEYDLWKINSDTGSASKIGSQIMEMPLQLRERSCSQRERPLNWKHQIMRLFGKAAYRQTRESEQKTWIPRDQNISNMERYKGALFESKQPKLSKIRTERDSNLQKVAEIRELSEGYGESPKYPEYFDRSKEWFGSLLSRKLSLGNNEGKQSQSVKQSQFDFSRANDVYNSLGRGIGIKFGNFKSQNTQTKMVNGESFNYSNRQTEKSATTLEEPALLEQATEELNPTLPVQQQQLNRPGRHPLPTPAFADTPPAPPPDWVRKVMETSFSTFPPHRIFTRPAQEIADAGDLEGIAPLGVSSWQKMVNFHRNRGGKKLPQLQRDELTKAIQMLSQRIKERRQQPDLYDPKTLLPKSL